MSQEHIHTIAAIDSAALKLTLSNGTSWAINAAEGPIIDLWKVKQRIRVESNDDVMAYPCRLVNIDRSYENEVEAIRIRS